MTEQTELSYGQRVLSVKNPWAYMIMFHGKDVENRTWQTAFRGRILIHASKKKTGMGDFLGGMPERFWYGKCVTLSIESDIYCGKIIGSVELADCIRDSGSEWAERGCWHWVLKDPRPFNTPVPARGMQGLWRYKGEMK